MAVRDALLKAIRSRSDRSGVLTADRYFSAIKACFADCEGGFCPTKLFEAGTQEEWAKHLRKARKQLTFSSDDTIVVPDTITKSVAGDEDIAGSILNFNAIVTTSSRDRDKDILDTKGAVLDPKSPLLWQHIRMQPIGKLVRQVQNTGNKLIAKFAIADTAQGRDAAALIELGALRISHGFDPTEYEPNDDDEGYLFSKFLIYEVSVVSIPANMEAVITAYDRKQLKSALIGGWAKKAFDSRPTIVAVAADVPKKSAESSCECHKSKTQKNFSGAASAGPLAGSYEDIAAALSNQLREHFLSRSVLTDDMDSWAYAVGTFADHIVVNVYNKGDSQSYSVPWGMVDGAPKLTGEPEKVSINVTVTVERLKRLKAAWSKSSPITDVDGDYQETGNDNPGVDDTPRVYRCPECGFAAPVDRFNYQTDPPATEIPNPKEKAMATKGKLAKEDMDSLNEAHEDMKCLSEMSDLPRAHKALCGRAMAGVKSALPGHGGNEGEEDESAIMAPEGVGVALKAMGGNTLKCVKEAYDDMGEIHNDSSNRQHKGLAFSSMCHLAKSMRAEMPMPGNTGRMGGTPINGTDTVGSGYEQATDKGFKSLQAQITSAAKDLPAIELRALGGTFYSMAEVKELV